MPKIDRRRQSRICRQFWFKMTKHYREPEDLSIDSIAGWIEGNGLDLYNWLPSTFALLWVILDAVTGDLPTRLARIKATHPLFVNLDDSSQSCENSLKCSNWLMWKGDIKRKEQEIKVTHFGPFGREKKEEFEKTTSRMKSKFAEGLKKIGISSRADILEKDGKKENANKWNEFKGHIGPHLRAIVLQIMGKVEEEKTKTDQKRREFLNKNPSMKDKPVTVQALELLLKTMAEEALTKMVKVGIKKVAPKTILKKIPIALCEKPLKKWH